MEPEISVVMSVHNGGMYLGSAIESILDQSFPDFEFIIIEDGSSDYSLPIIQDYASRDKRIRLIVNDKNIGLALSLNKGIKVARGKYIARMDADDISLPERFEKQIDFLETTPFIWVLGSNVIRIDKNGEPIREITYPTEPYQLRWNMLLGMRGTLCHPSVMMETKRIQEAGLYKNTATSQDTELWGRFFFYEPLPIHNLQIPLLKWRWHENNVSVKKAELQNKVSNQIRLDTVNRFFEHAYDYGVIESFRTLTPQTIGYSEKELTKYISAWFEIYQGFKVKFNLSNSQMKYGYEQILYRMRTYVSLNPLVLFNDPRIWLFELLPAIGFGNFVKILLYKLNKLNRYLLNKQRGIKTPPEY